MEEMDREWMFPTKEQKEEQRAATLDWLHTEKIPYTSHNNGLHLKITLNNKMIDYWPTTGRMKMDNKFFDSDLNGLITLKTIKDNHDK